MSVTVFGVIEILTADHNAEAAVFVLPWHLVLLTAIFPPESAVQSVHAGPSIIVTPVRPLVEFKHVVVKIIPHGAKRIDCDGCC